MDADEVLARTQHWLHKAVIGLNLCPFAKAVVNKGQVRYVVSDATTEAALLAQLGEELALLRQTPAREIDTTLLIHPLVLEDFLDYNDFLAVADDLLLQMELSGELQVASFHPQYQFANTSPDDLSNNTNRSPYPILHILREASVDKAVAAYEDASAIFERNVDTVTELGRDAFDAILRGD